MKTNKVLFVDDEVNILNAIKRSVIYEDFSAMFTLSGEKALELIKTNEISVIVTDMKMPGINGFELLKKVKEISPNTVRLVLSGYNQLSQILATVNRIGVFKYITKPWDDELDFLPSIREAVSYYNLRLENELMKKAIEKKNVEYEELFKTKDALIAKTELDVVNMKRINNLILQIQNILFSKLRSSIDYLDISEYYLKLINNIYASFLATFPSIIEEFDIERLVRNFIHKTNNKIPIQAEASDIKFMENYRLILLILVELVKYIVEKLNINDIVVEFMNSPTLSIKINCAHGNFHHLYNTNMEFKLIINYLRELIKTSKGNLIIEDNTNKEILIQVNTNT